MEISYFQFFVVRGGGCLLVDTSGIADQHWWNFLLIIAYDHGDHDPSPLHPDQQNEYHKDQKKYHLTIRIAMSIQTKNKRRPQTIFGVQAVLF